MDTDGSPLIALRWADIFKQEGRVNLRCFFTEMDTSSHSELEKNCKEINPKSEYYILPNGRFDERIDEIFQKLNDYPTIFFLDCFGVKGLTYEIIARIAKYLKVNKGELFLLFHNRSVARIAGQSTPNTIKERMIKAAASYTQNLTALLGPGSDAIWRPKWIELKDTPQEFEKWACSYLMSRLCKDKLFHGVASYDIREQYHDARPMYSILVCTNFPEKVGGELLNDFFCEEDRLLFMQSDSQNPAFFEKQWNSSIETTKAQLRPKVIKILGDLCPRWYPLEKVITKTILCQDIFAKLKRTHHRHLLLELYKEGLLEPKELGKNGKVTLKSLIRFKI